MKTAGKAENVFEFCAFSLFSNEREMLWVQIQFWESLSPLVGALVVQRVAVLHVQHIVRRHGTGVTGAVAETE